MRCTGHDKRWVLTTDPAKDEARGRGPRGHAQLAHRRPDRLVELFALEVERPWLEESEPLGESRLRDP